MDLKLFLLCLFLIYLYYLSNSNYIGGRKREKIVINKKLDNIEYKFDIDNYFDLDKNDLLITTCLFLDKNHSEKKRINI